MSPEILVLLAVFHVKHLLADFIFQTRYHLGKFSPKASVWVPALAAHALVHATLTFCIALPWGAPQALALALFDASIHFTMDRIKAGPKLLGRFKALSGPEYQNVAARLQSVEVLIADAQGDQLNRLLEVRRECWQRLNGNTYFWWALGLDQMVHGLTDLLVAYLLVR